MEKTDLIVIDMQKGILEKPVYRSEEVTKRVNRLIDFFHKEKHQVYFFRHNNDSFLLKNSEGWELSSGLLISKEDKIFDKSHSSIFKDKTVETEFEKNGIDTLVICGLVTNGCIQTACKDALIKGFRVILIGDAHSTYVTNPEEIIGEWNNTLAGLGAEILTAEEFLYL